MGWKPIAVGLILATIDALVLPITKLTATGKLPIGWMVLPTLFYAADPWIFRSIMDTEYMTTLNVIWDIMSDVLVSIIGIVYFREHLGAKKLLGLFLGIAGIVLMTC